MRFASLALAAALGLGAVSTSALAADGSSGCGPAWYVFKENTMLSSFVRLLTHGTLSPVVTIGMTLGTSNCTKHKLVLNDQESLNFASKSMDLLKQDIARGEGQHLNAYLASFGCHELARPALSNSLQRAFQENLHSTSSPVDYVETTRVLIDFSPSRSLCS